MMLIVKDMIETGVGVEFVIDATEFDGSLREPVFSDAAYGAGQARFDAIIQQAV